jgi:endonuclease IV
MQRIFSFGTGNFYQKIEYTVEYDRGYYDKLLGWCRKLDLDGVEIFFSQNESVRRFSISEDNLAWIKRQKYVTIHAPPALSTEESNAMELLEKLSSIYRRFGAKQLIIHPVCLPKRKILDRFDLKISTENLGKKRNVTISSMKKILDGYDIGLCLDVAHAYFWSKHETRKLINAFGKRITQVHFSGVSRRKPHVSLRKVSDDYIFSLKPLKELQVPVVIEQNMGKGGIPFAKSEISNIKRFFNG